MITSRFWIMRPRQFCANTYRISWDIKVIHSKQRWVPGLLVWWEGLAVLDALGSPRSRSSGNVCIRCGVCLSAVPLCYGFEWELPIADRKRLLSSGLTLLSVKVRMLWPCSLSSSSFPSSHCSIPSVVLCRSPYALACFSYPSLQLGLLSSPGGGPLNCYLNRGSPTWP